MTKTKVIFFGNGPLADTTLEILKDKFDIIFHARTKENLETVKKLKAAHPEAHGILASFGVLIKQDVLNLFEPEGILNIHPSKLPDLRGPSPIESAILRGDKDFSVSVMKLVKKMDAGPLYAQITLPTAPTKKSDLYRELASAGTLWLCNNLEKLPSPTPQDDSQATFCEKLNTTMSELKPLEKTSERLLNEIRAFENFPKSRYVFNNIDCIILEAHIAKDLTGTSPKIAPLCLECKDGKYLIIDQLQPAGRKPMDAKSFVNGYLKK